MEEMTISYIARTGYYDDGKVLVVDGDTDTSAPLRPRLDLENKSPTGFAWGYAGSGPAQLALAILAHATADDEKARRWFQRFKFECICCLPQKQGFTITQESVLDWLREKEADEAASLLPMRHRGFATSDSDFDAD